MSARPLDTTRELATTAGLLAYSEVAEHLAVNIAHCLDALLENPPGDIRITPEWICDTHRCIAGELFPEWAGCFRTADVQVGTHPTVVLYQGIRDILLSAKTQARRAVNDAMVQAYW